MRLGIPVWILLTAVLGLRGRPDDQTLIRYDSALDERAVLAHGFEFDTDGHDTCWISGPDGYCGIDAFVWGETSKDRFRHTCAKFNKAAYIGNCVAGRVEGVAIVIADGTGKSSKEAFVSWFSKGRIAYPALTTYVSPSTELNFGVRQKLKSYGCVYFGSWDRSNEREGCRRLKDIFGDDVFSEANARALRNGSFDLEKYRSRFMAFISRPR